MLLYEESTFNIRKAIFNVFNNLGCGHKELIYQKALEKEFNKLSISFKSESRLDVVYEGDKIGNYRPDFILDDKVILEIKAVEYISNKFEIQLYHYLISSHYKLGLLVNFGAPRLFIKRIVCT